MTKLQLDEAVAGDEEASKQTENEVKKSLIQRLRKKLEQEDPTVNMKTDTDTEPETATAITIEAEERSEPRSSQDIGVDLLSNLPALLAIASSPPSSFLQAEETPPVTQSPTPLPTPGEREQRDDIIMVDD